MKLWEVKTQFGRGRTIVKHVPVENLRIGAHPSSHICLPDAYPKNLVAMSWNASKIKVDHQDIKAEIKAEKDCIHCKFQDLSIEIREISKARRTVENRLEAWQSSKDLDLSKSQLLLWHICKGQLIESMSLEKSNEILEMPTSGFRFKLDWSMRKMILHKPGGDLRSIDFVAERGALRGVWADHIFMVTDSGSQNDWETLLPAKAFAKTQKRESIAPFFLMVIGVWFSLVAFLQFAPSMQEMDATVEEKLAPEFAKVQIEKRKLEKESAGGGGGGGGVQTATSRDSKGGAGYYDEVLVQDRNVLASAPGVLDAFSNLDKKMRAGTKAIGAGIIGGTNRAQGILAALGNMAGSGGGGTGVGGVGTKGFGGGGGGGTGTGFGTGVGAGVGKGDGRDLAFAEGASSVKGALEKSEINAVVDENFAQIRFCYNRALRTNPSLKGKVVSNFIIDGDGTVAVSRIGSTTLLNPSVENCIRDKITGWQFPKPRGGGRVTVNYPFLFNKT